MNALTIMRRDEQTELAQVGASQLQQWIMEFFVIKMTQKSEHTKRAYLADEICFLCSGEGRLCHSHL
jgi:hypothetical protein